MLYYLQAVKSAVQTITVGGVSTSQFKTIIPLATAPNVQQIQVPGSKFHYVRLVTATTANSATPPASQNPSTNTQPLQQGQQPIGVLSMPLTTLLNSEPCLAKNPGGVWHFS